MDLATCCTSAVDAFEFSTSSPWTCKFVSPSQVCSLDRESWKCGGPTSTSTRAVRLNYTPPPELVALSGGDYHRLVHAMKKQERETLASLHERRRM